MCYPQCYFNVIGAYVIVYDTNQINSHTHALKQLKVYCETCRSYHLKLFHMLDDDGILLFFYHVIFFFSVISLLIYLLAIKSHS